VNVFTTTYRTRRGQRRLPIYGNLYSSWSRTFEYQLHYITLLASQRQR